MMPLTLLSWPVAVESSSGSGQRFEGCGLVEGSVRSMLIVVGLVFTKDLE